MQAEDNAAKGKLRVSVEDYKTALVMWGKTYTRRRRARDVRRAAERAGARRDAERAVVAGTVHATEDEAISASG